MWNFIPVIILQVVLPLCFLTCYLIRPCLLSLPYGFLLFAWPFVSRLSYSGEIRGCTKKYVKISLAASGIALLCHVIFHLASFAVAIDDNNFSKCGKAQTISRAVGLQRSEVVGTWELSRLIVPDAAAFVISIIAYIVSSRYEPRRDVVTKLDDIALNAVLVGFGPKVSQRRRSRHIRRQCGDFFHVNELCGLILLALCGVISPSVSSSVYFLAYLVIITWWSVYLPVKQHTFNLVKFLLIFYSALNIIVVYVCQLEIFQKVFDLDSLPAKVFGLPFITNSTCFNNTLTVSAVNNQWPVYLYPFVLLLFYVYTGFQLSFDNDENNLSHDGESGEIDPFLSASNDVNHETTIRSRIVAHHDSAVVNNRLFSFESLVSGKSDGLALETFVSFIVRHSYVLSLIMMMAWAITYHCWLSFVWLMLACFIWLVVDSRSICLKLSPFIVAYAEVLLCLEFVYGIRSQLGSLVEDVWPDEFPNAPLLQIGLISPKGPACFPLLLKVVFSVPFWILLRVFLREKCIKKSTVSPRSARFSLNITHRQSMSITGNGFFGSILIKYWIYVVAFILLLISVRQPVVIYTLFYMVFFLVLITVFQVSFRIWRLMMFTFWSLLVIFSILILLLVYTYQFHGIPTVWKNWTGWENSNETIFKLKDVGLVEYDSGNLFMQLLTPISFLIVVILQLKFFHHDFMRLIDFKRIKHHDEFEQPNNSDTQGDFTSKILRITRIVREFIWRLSQLHIAKLVALSLMLVAITEVSATNLVFVILASIMLTFKNMHYLASIFANLWSSSIIIGKMLYQMKFVSDTTISVTVDENCSIYSNERWHDIDPAKWAGFEKTDNIAFYLMKYILLCSLLTFKQVVKVRQEYKKMRPNKKEIDNVNILFPNIKRQDADESIENCCKFLANYWFYKFGIETCYIIMIVDIGIRMDAAALIYSVWLLVMLCLPRYVAAQTWWMFVAFLGIFIPFQYMLCVGLPPSPCAKNILNVVDNVQAKDLPNAVEDNLYAWLYLPSYDRSRMPNSYFLLADFFLFLCASCQLRAFRAQLSPEVKDGVASPASASLAVTPKRQLRHSISEDLFYSNPVPNFIIYTKSYLDMVKIVVFSYFHWFTLVIIFAAGFGRISAFAFGYLVAAFCLLWKGNDLYLESFRHVEIRWYMLLIYNVLAILLKVFLQIAGCGYLKRICGNYPILIRLFSIACLSSRYNDCPADSECCISPEEPEIFYDGLCFSFLMLQMQIFHSWYFKHSIAAFKAERILSARGAVVIRQLMKKELKQQQEAEAKVLEKLINKTSKIRERYLKKLSGKKVPTYTTYGEGKRCGDYYMFEYDSDSDEDLGKEEQGSESLLVLPEPEGPHQKTSIGPLQLAHMVISKDFDLEQTVEECKEKMRRVNSCENGISVAVPQAVDAAKDSDVDDLCTEMPKPRRHLSVASDLIKDTPGPSDDTNVTEKPKWSKLMAIKDLLSMFIVGVLESSQRLFNALSRDCRYVAYVLKNEKKLLMETLTKELESEGSLRRFQEKLSTKEIGKKIRKIPTTTDIENVETQVKTFETQHNTLMRFLIALYYLLFSRTELLCYMMMILDHMSNAALISLPLPLFVFFWGTLCSPRPPKFFWITVITYTEAMIVIKFIFQFDFFPSKFTLNDPLHPIAIIGLEKSNYYVVWDVALLMVLFFHRYVLKTLGLWKELKPGDAFRSATCDSLNKSHYSMAEYTDSAAVKVAEEFSTDTAAFRRRLLSYRGKLSELSPYDYVRTTEMESAATSRKSSEIFENRKNSTPNISGGGSCNTAAAANSTHMQNNIVQSDGCYSGIEIADRAENDQSSKKEKNASKKKARFAYFASVVLFYTRLFRPDYHYVTDMYSLMFVCDITCLLILAFGYSSFGVAAEQGDVVSDIKSNKVPLPFVVMLIALMILIIVDRGIYLRKSVVAKLIFQYMLVVGVHAWIFFALPAITDISTINNSPAKFWYFVKCVYFLLSAWQIKNGYRSRRFGNALTKHYNLFNYCLFTGFMAAPFLFELRTLVDWIWTETSMPLFDYFSMENIYAAVYRLKCMRKMEKDYPVEKGKAQGPLIKYGVGFPILVFIVVLLWLPLLLFGLLNAIGRGLLPIHAKFTISIKGYPPLYESNVYEPPALATISSTDNAFLGEKFNDKRSLMFLRDYDSSAIMRAVFSLESDTFWTLSTPFRKKMRQHLRNFTTDVSLVFIWEFTRPRESSEREPATQSSSHTVVLKPRSRARHQLARLIDDSPSTINEAGDGVLIEKAFPSFVEVPSYGEVQPARSLLRTLLASGNDTSIDNGDSAHIAAYSTINLSLNRDTTSVSDLSKSPDDCCKLRDQYWRAVCVDHRSRSGGSQGSKKNMEMVVFVDKVFPSVLDVFTSKGIIGVYVVVVLAAGRFMRSLVVTSPLEIMITEMPNVDQVLQLCLDIYLVREARDFVLELDLFAKLIFLIRSPETLIKWTRPKLLQQ